MSYVFTRGDLNTLSRAVDMNINRLNKILREAPNMAENNRQQMTDKLARLERLADKLEDMTLDD